jgi:hypothetical protein
MMTMLMVMTQKSGVGDVIAKIVIVSPRIAFGSKEMEVPKARLIFRSQAICAMMGIASCIT